MPAWSERDGSFLLADLIPGTYTLEARAPGHVEAIQEAILVAEGRATAVFISLAPSPRFLGDVVVTPSRYSFLHRAPESHQFFDRAEVQRMPHLADDPFRVAHRLPGVAAADISARFSARGGTPDEVQVVLDGLEIHDPYHLRQYNKGLSIVDSEVIGGVDLLTGGFPIEYGDRMSGVVDLSTTVPTAQRFAIGASGLNARALAEGAGDGGGYSWLVSTRVGYLDWLFHWLETIDESPDLAGSPKYWDLYTVLRRQLGDNSLLSLHLLVADDDVNAYDRNEHERAVGADTNLYGWANLFSAFGAGVTARTVLSATQVTRQLQGSSDPGALNFARVRDDRRFSIFGLKQDWEWEPRRSQVLKLGFDVSHVGARYDYDGSFITYDPLFTGSGPPWVVTREADVRAEGWQVALYTADRFQLAPGVTVELGVRWDRQTWTPGKTSSARASTWSGRPFASVPCGRRGAGSLRPRRSTSCRSRTGSTRSSRHSRRSRRSWPGRGVQFRPGDARRSLSQDDDRACGHASRTSSGPTTCSRKANPIASRLPPTAPRRADSSSCSRVIRRVAGVGG